MTRPDRPRVRLDCIGSWRPCPWHTCRYHLCEADHETGPTCTLDLVDKNPEGMELREVAAAMRLSIDEVEEILRAGLACLEPEMQALAETLPEDG